MQMIGGSDALMRGGKLDGGLQTTLRRLLFGTSNATGFTFEPWDITTLYQDRAGTTPVTAAGQSVGLRLSKDQGLVLGSELVDTANTAAAWVIYGTNTVSQDGDAVRVNFVDNASGAYLFLNQSGGLNANLVAGKTYQLQVQLRINSGSANFAIYATALGNYIDGQNITNTAYVTRAFTFQYVSGSPYIQFANLSAGESIWIRNISVRELAGNHEVAINDAARGVYGREPESGTRNLLTYTEQFDNDAWAKSNVIVTANSLIANAVNGYHGVSISNPLGSVGVLTQQIEAKANGYNWLMIGDSFSSGGGLQRIAFFNIATGNLGAVQGAGVTSTIVPTTDGYFLCTVTFTATNGATSVAVSNADNTRTFTGDGVSGILVRKVQTELGASATAYQKVVSRYDITEEGVPSCYYVQTDGVDDAYVTPTITPGTDKAQVFMGLQKIGTGDTVQIIAEMSVTRAENNGAFTVGVPGSVAGAGASLVSRGTVDATAQVTTGYTPPTHVVLTGLADISGDVATLRANGSQIAQSTADQGTGNYLAYPVYIYARGGTSLPFNGRDYGHAVRFGPNLDAATIARVEALIARNTPTVTL